MDLLAHDRITGDILMISGRVPSMIAIFIVFDGMSMD